MLWKRAESSGLVFRASSLAVTRECRLDGAALAGVSSSTVGGKVGARRRMGVFEVATTGTGAGGGGAGLGEVTAVIDDEMSLMASRQATLSCRNELNVRGTKEYKTHRVPCVRMPARLTEHKYACPS